ncbi:ECF transporter S component [Mycoplasma simbae]|uniref:ECF transporter S component n=1 Tax=Mycoplasma simbae TaxID=36744 RepID=UPI000497ADE1|nr:ECF transporter S component [Mycoplasma simbae]
MSHTELKKQKSVWKPSLKSIFYFSVYDIVLSAILLSLHIVVMMFAKFTILAVIPLQLEFILYIFYGLILGPFKGSLLSIVGDTVVLLITGTIGTWFYIYALIPPAIAIVSWLYYWMFKSTKYTRFIVSYILMLISFILVIWVYAKHSENDGTFKLTKKVFAPKDIMIVLMFVYAFLAFALSTTFLGLYIKFKNEKWNDYMMVTSLILFVSVVFRWVIGPVAFIEYYNYFTAPKSGKLKHYSIDYIVLFVKIVVKDLFAIPIYIAVLAPVYSAVKIMESHFSLNKNVRY